MPTDEEALKRPIGWWLKEADGQLNAAFDRALAGTGIDRRGWQILSTLASGPKSHAELVASLAPFDPASVIQRVVADLESQQLVEGSTGLLELTPDGGRTHAELTPLVDGVRQQIRGALSSEDYVTLVQLLARLTESVNDSSKLADRPQRDQVGDR